MRAGADGKYDTWGNEFSITYRPVKPLEFPNPSLSAIL